LVDALTPVDIFNDEFATSFSDEYFDTIGGLVAQKFGCVPKPGQSCTLQQRTFKVLRANSRQIQSFEVTRLD
jgi:magnesium and cobalt transporter